MKPLRLRRRRSTPLASGEAVALRSVDAHRDRTLALRDLSFELQTGTVTAVIGPNGAGKSSMFGLISGRLRASRGTVDVAGPVAEVQQSTQIDDHLPLTVDDVVRMGRYATRGLLGPLRRADRDIVYDALERVDLLPLRRRPISELSGGQQQRALLAQGLAQQAPVLLLDEPTTGLDAASRRRVLEIMRAEADRGRTVLFATHDLGDAREADTVIALACECICCAPPLAALSNPTVTALFATPTQDLEPAEVPEPTG